jgi:hypothetical protein
VVEAARQDEAVGAVCAAAGAPAPALEVTAGLVDRWTMRLPRPESNSIRDRNPAYLMFLAVPAGLEYRELLIDGFRIS